MYDRDLIGYGDDVLSRLNHNERMVYLLRVGVDGYKYSFDEISLVTKMSLMIVRAISRNIDRKLNE